MRRRCTDRYMIKITIAFLLIVIGVIIIISYIPAWIWLCLVGALLIALGCFVLKR